MRPSISTSILLAVLMANPRAVMRVLRAGDLRDVQVAGEPQRLRQSRHAHAPQIFAGDDRNRRGDIGEPLDAARGGRDVGVDELFDRELLEFVELAGAGGLRESASAIEPARR